MLLVVVISLSLASVYVAVLINTWYGDSTMQLQAKDLTPTPVTVAGHELFTLNPFFYLMGKFTLLVAFLAIVDRCLSNLSRSKSWRSAGGDG